MSTILERYADQLAGWSDIIDHLPLLRALAAECDHVTEFGTRHGVSTVAFLAGLPSHGRMVSYDVDPGCARFDDPRWSLTVADTGALTEIDETDLLFIDTLHDAAHVAAELRNGNRARRWLVFHDTVLFGTADETTGAPPGILHAIFEFMAANPHWRVRSHDWRSCGLLVLVRT